MVKGGKDKVEGEDADAKYERWKRLLPVLYDSFTNHNLVWPSLSCRWGPRVEDYTYKVKQRAYLSEQTDGSVPNTLVVANVEVPRPHVAESESMQSFNYSARSPLVRKYKTIIHPGEVNRIREYPEAQHIVATHSDVPEVYIWNVDTQPERKEDAKVQGSAASQPDLVLTGHVQDAKFAMAFHAKEPRLISGGEDGEVLLWHLEDHISSLASAAPPQEEPTTDSGGAGRKSLNSGGLGGLDEDTPGTSTSVKERSRFKGHTDTIEDVVFRPGNADEFCSVGDDKALIFWDARQEGGKPAAKVAAAHSDDIHTVDWNGHSEHLVLTGSADHTVRLFDRRKLAREGKDAVVHTFAAHSDAILNVQWCPHRGSAFASGGEDGLVMVWDTDRIAGGANGSVKKKPPPELIFQHAGHRDKVVDFQWNMHDPWTILSVSDDINYAGGGGALQIWRINDLVYLPEEEALGELKRHQDYITGKSNRIADRAQESKVTEPPAEGTSELPKEEGPPEQQEAAAQDENAAALAGDGGQETLTTQEVSLAKEAAGTAETEEEMGQGEAEEASEQVEKDEKSGGKEEQATELEAEDEMKGEGREQAAELEAEDETKEEKREEATELVAEDERGEARERVVGSQKEDEREGEEKNQTMEPIEEDVQEAARQGDALEHVEGKGGKVDEAMEFVEAATKDALQEDVEMTEAPEETQEPKPDDSPR